MTITRTYPKLIKLLMNIIMIIVNIKGTTSESIQAGPSPVPSLQSNSNCPCLLHPSRHGHELQKSMSVSFSNRGQRMLILKMNIRQETIQSSTGLHPCTWTISHHQQITASVDGGQTNQNQTAYKICYTANNKGTNPPKRWIT